MSEPTIIQPPASQPVQTESPWWSYALLSLLAVLLIVGIAMNWPVAGKAAQEAHYEQWKTLLGVIVVLCIFTVLYRENPLFRFMEHIFIGLAAGAGIVVTWVKWLYPNWYVVMAPKSMAGGEGQGNWWLFPAFLFGLLFFTVYFRKLSWMNRFALGVVMGWVSGMAFREFFSLLAPQIVTSLKSPVTLYDQAKLGPLNNIKLLPGVWVHPFALVFVVVLLCVGAYFFFSAEHRAGWIRQPAVAGRYLLMITLGAIFGTTVMGRFSLVIERVNFLVFTFKDWGQMLWGWLH